MRKLVALATVILGVISGMTAGAWLMNAMRPFFTISSLVSPHSLHQSLLPHVPRITAPQNVYVFFTAYDPYDEACVGQYAHIWPRRTATGSDAEIPGAAADLAVIPAGSRIETSFGAFVIDDDGGAMRNAARSPSNAFYWIDIRIPADYTTFPSADEARRRAHEEASKWGAHWAEARIIPPSGS